MGVKYKNNEATQKLKKAFGSSMRLPGNVQFILENNERDCRIKLDPQKIQTENMQINANAFEAWAVALHVALNESGMIILDVDGEFEPMEYMQNGHWGRFLYRALRFSEQYEWFTFDEAYEKLEFDSNKTALWELNQRLLNSDLK